MQVYHYYVEFITSDGEIDNVEVTGDEPISTFEDMQEVAAGISEDYGCGEVGILSFQLLRTENK